jgi:hypothetical protein
MSCSPTKGTQGLALGSTLLHEEWYRWIDSLDVEWDWFCVLTFKTPTTAAQAKKAWLWWIRKVSNGALGRRARSEHVPWLRVVEAHKGEGVHLHALVSDVGSLSSSEYLALWKGRYGFIACVESYDASRDGLRYVLKHVGRGAEPDVSRCLEKRGRNDLPPSDEIWLPELWTPDDLDPLARLLHDGGEGDERVYRLSTHEGRAAWQRAWTNRLRVVPAGSTKKRKRKRPRSALRPVVTPLWTVRDLADLLCRSERWVYTSLQRDPEREGSVPFLRLPGGGPRFDPATIQAWLAQGCPAASRVKKEGQL